jgi:hypothetical protein
LQGETRSACANETVPDGNKQNTNVVMWKAMKRFWRGINGAPADAIWKRHCLASATF